MAKKLILRRKKNWKLKSGSGSRIFKFHFFFLTSNLWKKTLILAFVVLQLKSRNEHVARDKTISRSEFRGKAFPIKSPPLLWLIPTRKLSPKPNIRKIQGVPTSYYLNTLYLENQSHWHYAKTFWEFLDHVTLKVWFRFWHVVSIPYLQYFVPILLSWVAIMLPSFWGHNWDNRRYLLTNQC